MAKNPHSAPQEAPEPVLSVDNTGFLASQSDDYQKRFSDQIARLQERQLEMVKQTAEELEGLKREFENSKGLEEKINAARQPLLVEVQTMQAAMQQLQQHNALLEEQLRIAQQGYQTQYAQLQGVISGLKNAMRAQAQSFDQQLRVFSMDATQSLESMLNTLEVTELPSLSVPQTPALPKTLPDVQSAKFIQHEEKMKRVIEREKPLNKKGLRRFAVRTLIAITMVGAGFGGWKVLANVQKSNLAATLASTSNKGTVAGVSTDPSITSQNPTYPEAQVDLPYAETKWAALIDPDMGINMQYPQNTSDKVRPIGADNLWILRKNGYLMEFTEDTSATTLAAWQAANQSNLSLTYSVSQGQFKGLPAVIMKPLQQLPTSGTQYAIVQGSFILVVWVKDEDPQSDDGQRITYMLSTLTFTKPTAQ